MLNILCSMIIGLIMMIFFSKIEIFSRRMYFFFLVDWIEWYSYVVNYGTLDSNSNVYHFSNVSLILNIRKKNSDNRYNRYLWLLHTWNFFFGFSNKSESNLASIQPNNQFRCFSKKEKYSQKFLQITIFKNKIPSCFLI